MAQKYYKVYATHSQVTYNCKEPTNRSHPITILSLYHFWATHAHIAEKYTPLTLSLSHTHSALQHAVVCCSVLQCVPVCCNVQCVATCCKKVHAPHFLYLSHTHTHILPLLFVCSFSLCGEVYAAKEKQTLKTFLFKLKFFFHSWQDTCKKYTLQRKKSTPNSLLFHEVKW